MRCAGPVRRALGSASSGSSSAVTADASSTWAGSGSTASPLASVDFIAAPSELVIAALLAGGAAHDKALLSTQGSTGDALMQAGRAACILFAPAARYKLVRGAGLSSSRS